MLNRICIMGRLVRDPELRRTQSGVPVTTIRIAVDRNFKNQDGSKTADFFDVVAWERRAEFISKYFTKGRMAIVEGRLQSRNWQDQEGNKRYAVEIVADNVYFGDSRRDNGGEYGGYGSGGYGSTGGYGSSGYGTGGYSSGSYGAGGYGSGSSGGYGSGSSAASGGYGSGDTGSYASGGTSSSSSGFGGSSYSGRAPGYGSTSEEPSSQSSEFADLGEDDGDLPF